MRTFILRVAVAGLVCLGCDLLLAGPQPGPEAGLLPALTKDDPAVRREALEGLSGAGLDAARCVPVLVEALDDEDPGVRKAASDELLRLGQLGAPVLLEDLEHVDLDHPPPLFRALEEIRRLGAKVTPKDMAAFAQRAPGGALFFLPGQKTTGEMDPGVLAALASLADRPRAFLGESEAAAARARALAVMAVLGVRARDAKLGETATRQPADPDATWPRLRKLVEGKDDPRSIFVSLIVLDEGWSDPAFLEALHARFRKQDPFFWVITWLRAGRWTDQALREARQTLAGMALRAEPADALGRIVAEEDLPLRSYAAIELARRGIGDRGVLRVLHEALEAASDSVGGPSRLATAVALLLVSPSDAEARKVVRSALTAKGRTGDDAFREVARLGPAAEAFLPELLSSLEKGHDLPGIARTLAALGPRAAPAVRGLTKAFDAWREDEAAHAGSDALDRLVKEGGACASAALPGAIVEALRAIGPAAEAAAPELEALAQGPDPRLAYLAARALRAIRTR